MNWQRIPVKITIVLAMLVLLMYSQVIYAKTIITKSIDDLTINEQMMLLEWNPEVEGYTFLPVADPSRFEKAYELPNIQEVVLLPLRVEEGPQFVRPQELFAIRVVVRNVDDIAYQIALIRRPSQSIFERVLNAWNWLVSNVQRIFGFSPQVPREVNETWEVVPIYYLIAALNPKEIQAIRGNTLLTIYPGGLIETKPGYGCYDIVLGNEYQFMQVVQKLEKGEITFDELMCGTIDTYNILGFKIPKANSMFGPITVVLPVEVYKEGGQLGKAVVQVRDGEVLSVLQGCTDKGDGRDYYLEKEIGGQKYRVYIPSRPRDCILNPGESMEFVVYGLVNPLPSGMIPPEAVGEVITNLYADPRRGSEMMNKYPGAIHELLFIIGRVNDVRTGITTEDIVKSFGSFVAPAAGAVVGGVTMGPVGALVGGAVGLLVNWIALGSPFKVPVIEKAFACVYTGRCIYETIGIYFARTYIVIAAPQFQVTLYLVHLGLVVLMIVAGGYLGYRMGGS
ncbi:MAG: hypothetical protein QXL14_01355 [Candidatus Aenigmatarchaeota archaeon]